MKIGTFGLYGLLFLAAATSGCIKSDLQLADSKSIPPFWVTESVEYLITLENSGGILEKKFFNLQVQFIDEKNIVEPLTEIDRSELGKGEKAQIKLTLVGKKEGATSGILRITHSEGSSDFDIPVEVKAPKLSVSLIEEPTFGELEVDRNRKNDLTVKITNEDNTLYKHGKVRISPAYSWVNFEGAQGYTTQKENSDFIIDTQIPASTEVPFTLIPIPPGEHVGFSINVFLLWSWNGDRWAEIDKKTIKLTTD